MHENSWSKKIVCYNVDCKIQLFKMIWVEIWQISIQKYSTYANFPYMGKLFIVIRIWSGTMSSRMESRYNVVHIQNQYYALVLFFRRCCCYIYAYDQKTVYVSQNFIIYSSESLSMLYACVCLYDVICVCQRSFSIFQGHDFYFMKPKIEVNELMMITRTIPTWCAQKSIQLKY